MYLKVRTFLRKHFKVAVINMLRFYHKGPKHTTHRGRQVSKSKGQIGKIN